MTDRDLLEKAAKAAGIEIHWHTNGTSWAPAADCGDFSVEYEGMHAWNPLTDDGDALRLAVKLRIMLDQIDKGYMAGYVVAVSVESFYEKEEPDPCAATRRAIVRAAAAMSEQ